MNKASFRKALIPAFLAALALGYLGRCDKEQDREEPTSSAVSAAANCGADAATIEQLVNKYTAKYNFREQPAMYLKENLCNALAVEEKYGIPAAAVIAKAASEHRFGEDETAKLLIEKANNHFGLKYSKQYAAEYSDCIDKETWEHKTSNKEIACFVVYPNAQASYLHFGEFLATRKIGNWKPYEHVMQRTHTSEEFLKALADSSYSTNKGELKLTTDLLNQYHLDELVAVVKKELQKPASPKPEPPKQEPPQQFPQPSTPVKQGEIKKIHYNHAAFSLELYSAGFRQGDLILLELQPKGVYDAAESTLEFTVKKEDGKEKTLTLPKFQKGEKIYALLGTDFTYPAQDAALNVDLLVDGSHQQQSYSISIAARDFIREDLQSKTTKNAAAPNEKAKREAAAENHAIGQAYGTITHAPYFISDFNLPAKGVCKAESFGSRRFIDGEEKSRHKGVDCKGSIGDIIAAPLPGKVELAVQPRKGVFSYMGNHTMLDHGFGLYTLYGHQTVITVNEGSLVQSGQQLGTVGATGRASGPHLHWQAYLYKMKIDPLSLKVLGEVF